METALHTQKISILSRLIKESSLTLEEALLLLKEDEEEIVEQEPAVSTFDYGRYTGSGTITVPNITGTTYMYTTSSGYNTIGNYNNMNFESSNPIVSDTN
jgi:hypothetical protein